MPGDATIPLPSSSGGPTLDAELYTNDASTVVDRERIATVPGIPSKSQTTLDNNNVSASGDNVLVAGISAKTIRVMRLLLIASAPVTINFKDGAGTTLMGPITLGSGGSIVLDDTGEPWFVTSAANDFILNLSAAVQVTCTLWFTQS